MTRIEAELPQTLESLLRVRFAGLQVAMLIVGDPLGGLAIDLGAGRPGQRLSRQPRVGGEANLFDSQVGGVEFFFL